MIPKTIHYCWLSDDPLPEAFRRCMDTWRSAMPNFKLRHWGKRDFDINSNSFVAAACQASKWGFAADYIRLHALYFEGGIYLDADTTIRKSLEPLLKARFFSAVESHPHITSRFDTSKLIDPAGYPRRRCARVPGLGVQAAVLGSEPGHPLVHDILEYYSHYYDKPSKFFIGERFSPSEIMPTIIANVMEGYGFRYLDEKQSLPEGITILSSLEIASSAREQPSSSAYAVHNCFGTWRDRPPERNFRQRLFDYMRRPLTRLRKREVLLT